MINTKTCWGMLQAAAFFTLTSTATLATAAPKACTDTIQLGSAVVSGFGFNQSNTRNQPSSINSTNVARLTVAQTHVAEGTVEKRSVPAVTAGTIFFAEGRDIVARNRQSGCEYWRYSSVDKSTLLVGSNAIRSSSIYYLPGTLLRPSMVYAGDFYGNVYAINARTGKEVWKGFMGNDTTNHFITGSFQVHNGVLFVPVATKEVITTVLNVLGNCCKSHGVLRAVDAYTGKTKWLHETSAAAKFNWSTGELAPSGMSIWGTPAIDTANNNILFGTGQNLSQPATDNSDSIVAVDINTGATKWVFQATKGDAWNAACQAPKGLDSHCPKEAGKDWDFGAPPILTKLPNGTPIVLAGGKNGVVYSLNPKTGAINWSTRIGVGGSLGGIHWGMAVDGQRVYAASTDIYVNKLERLNSTDVGEISAQGMAPEQGATPGIYALDLISGKVIWSKHFKHTVEGVEYDSLHSAALSVTNDVLFAGSLNGVVRALRVTDGEVLWSHDTAVSVTDVNGVVGNGGTIDSAGPVPAGKDLLLNSGYKTFGGKNAWQAGPGNALFVFRLP